MKPAASTALPFARLLFKCCVTAAPLVFSGVAPAAQEAARTSTDVQREAMHKLAFLAGRWSGPITVIRGPGEPLRLTQTENVQFKLDGLVLLIEGQSTGSDGKVLFSALATISYDDASHTYRFRAYNDGHYLENGAFRAGRRLLLAVPVRARAHREHDAPYKQGRMERGDGCNLRQWSSAPQRRYVASASAVKMEPGASAFTEPAGRTNSNSELNDGR